MSGRLAPGVRAAAAPLDGHLWHTIEAVGFMVVALGSIMAVEYAQKRSRAAVLADVRAPGAGVEGSGARAPVTAAPASGGDALQRMVLPLVVLAGLGAAAVHVVVMPHHFQESLLYGMFFAVAASCQALWSLYLAARPARALLVVGGLGNLAIFCLWLFTRLAEIPLGPAAGSREDFGGLDVLSSAFEMAIAIGALLLVIRPRALSTCLRPSGWPVPVRCAGVAIAVAVGATAVIWPAS